MEREVIAIQIIHTVFVLFNAQVLIDAHPLTTEGQLRLFTRQADKRYVTQIGERLFLTIYRTYVAKHT